jgi:hypothetical protein
VVDVRDPSHPVGVASYNGKAGCYGVVLDNHNAYVEANGGLAALAVTNPVNPVYLSGY